MEQDPVVIVGAARTPIGALMGELAPLPAPSLGGAAIAAALARSGVGADAIAEVLMGCVLPAGQGQAPARQAARAAGLPAGVGAITLNKVCGSGMKALQLAHDMLLAGSGDCYVAGGMESMSNAPHLFARARAGLRFGHAMVFDHMAFDGLEDAYERKSDGSGRAMGEYAEDCAAALGIARASQDAFAIASTQRAREAAAAGHFDWEIAPLEVPGRDGLLRIDRDETPTRVRLDRIPGLRPAFRPDGTITAASASSISDGAAALVLMRASEAARRGLMPLARIHAHATHARAPADFPTAPIGAIGSVLERAGWVAAQVDLWEINEAFAVVTLAAMQAFGLPHERVNVHGGACALGHPIGASGARIVVTLIGALRRLGLRRGVASLCIGGGEATAMAIELA
ncbi:acetyl-CoA C-acyltransferase [Niveibacterium sp. SC-1]|uniref:acetyl-CoA C-acyltransferase n=1 Tax=Niveibacterium sp. SC-1 TaxID=3135646 RepID=UPI00311D4BA5